VWVLVFIVGKVVEYKGDTLIYLWQENKILLIGNVEVKFEDLTLVANRVEFDAKEEIVRAYEEPVLKSKERDIEGEMMVYDLKEKKGAILKGKTTIQKGWFTGEIIKKVAPEELNVEEGEFTTCNLHKPHYWFWGKHIKVYSKDMVVIKPLILRVKGVPVFYLPFWWFPIKEGRQSGFLHPKIGKSNYWGRYVEDLSYFWVINRWSDFTFTLNYYEFKGPRMLMESRWKISKIEGGNFSCSYVNEHKPLEKKSKRRWSVDFKHNQKWKKIDIQAKGDFLSDDSVKVDYEEERLVNLDKIMNSYLSLNRSWDFFIVRIVVDERRNLVTKEVKRILPQISYNMVNYKLLGINFSFSGEYEKMIKNGIQEVVKENSLYLGKNFQLLTYFNLSLSSNHTYTIPSLHSPPRYSKYYQFSVGTHLYGKALFFPSLKHKMSPYISYSIKDDTLQGLNFYVNNDVKIKKYKVVAINLKGSFNFKENKLNPINITTQSLLEEKILDLRGEFKYFWEEDSLSFERFFLRGRINFPTIKINYQYYHSFSPKEQSIEGGLWVKLTTNWTFEISRRYDFLKKELIGESFGIYRNIHCWQAVFSFTRHGERWYYDFKLNLKAIPEIEVGKGVFGFLE
jgi:hypothetical protein